MSVSFEFFVRNRTINFNIKLQDLRKRKIRRRNGLPMYDAPYAVEELKRPRLNGKELCVLKNGTNAVPFFCRTFFR